MKNFAEDGFCFFIFNLSPDFNYRGTQLIKDANIRLNITFRKKLPNAIQIMAYGMYDAMLEITKDRRIIRDPYG